MRRRDFLKGVGAAAVAVVLRPAASLPALAAPLAKGGYVTPGTYLVGAYHLFTTEALEDSGL